MPKILITDYVTEPGIEREVANQNNFDVVCGPVDKAQAADIEGLLVWHEKINATYVDQFPNLRCVVRYGVGYDDIDLDALESRDIAFANTPDYGTDEVSDTAIGMALCGVRGITQSQAIVSSLADGTWQENVIPRIQRTKDTRLGVIGIGRIGTAVALKARALGFKTGFYDPNVSRGVEKSLSLERFESLSCCLAGCDVVSVHVPLNDETVGFIDAEFIAQMKDGAILINTARGKLIADLSLIFAALENEKLAFTGIDVLPDEPLLPSHPQHAQMLTLMKTGRLIVNPHTAYFSEQAYREMRQLAAENLLGFLTSSRSLWNRLR